MMMGYWLGGFGWIGLVVNLVISIALIIGVVFLVIWIVKQLRYDSGRELKNTTTSAIEIVKERYAKGEITREEFQKLLVDFGTR